MDAMHAPDAAVSEDAQQGLPAPGQPLIEVRGLWSVFPVVEGGEVVVHKDLDLTVLRGEVLTLVGGSGTGKTVLLRQMLGLNTPHQGPTRSSPRWTSPAPGSTPCSSGLPRCSPRRH